MNPALEMVPVQPEKLTDRAIDFAIARLLNFKVTVRLNYKQTQYVVYRVDRPLQEFRPSTNWRDAGSTFNKYFERVAQKNPDSRLWATDMYLLKWFLIQLLIVEYGTYLTVPAVLVPLNLEA